jgi:hypothetical protein
MIDKETDKANGMCPHGNFPSRCPTCNTDFEKEPVVDLERLSRSLARMAEEAPEGVSVQEFVTGKLVDLFRNIDPDRADALSEQLAQIQVSEISGAEEFLHKITSVLDGFFSEHYTKDSLEKLKRDAFTREGGFEPLSDVLSFGHWGSIAHIHLAPAETMGPKQLIRGVSDGMKELARRIQEDEALRDIENVSATSWIVAKNPRLLERLGFEVHGEISDERREEHFAGEERPVWSSSMTREELIKRYGGK